MKIKERKESKKSSSNKHTEEELEKIEEEIARKPEERHKVRKKIELKKMFSSLEGRNCEAATKERSYLHKPGLEAEPGPPASPPSPPTTCSSGSSPSPATMPLSPQHSTSGDKGGRGPFVRGPDIGTLHGEGGSATAAIHCGTPRDTFTEGRRQQDWGRHGLFSRPIGEQKRS